MEYQIIIDLLDKVTKVSRGAKQIISEKVINENDKKIPKERYICPEERQKIIENLRLVLWYDIGISKNNTFPRQYTKSTN